ncbi:hypothetical protein BT67DRAFT_435036 [Trichocladium antarcticum]|uniref:Uncharacterized protein n=1 Tax=Trichocladium antarcticum TaxID=1450529 RepID=A0AAN6UI92_9PEZI|nr:hypothetical protein BT67DRAFT_435036 [Trichocladium antarcticum]
MNRGIECRSEGCTNEVLFKTLDGASGEAHGRRSSSGRSPLSPADRDSPLGRFLDQTNSIQVSPYCRQHTCAHFHGDERCLHQKPPHDTVCAIHTRCPVPNCAQARVQFLDPAFDPSSKAIPRYVRLGACADRPKANFCQARKLSVLSCWDWCRIDNGKMAARLRTAQSSARVSGTAAKIPASDSIQDQCRTRGCRTIVEGKFPYCTTHIKCGMNVCGEARHLFDKTAEYHAYCVDHATCVAGRCSAMKLKGSPFCDGHTCRARDCEKRASSQPYCGDHGCAESSCLNPRAWASNPDPQAKFCPLHTCRTDDCQASVDRLSIFCTTHGCSKPKCHQETIAETLCIDHLKAQYITVGIRQGPGS